MEREIKDLVSFGLAENEAKAYLNLLNRNYTATELSKLLNINRTNIYKIINKLIEKGFCSKSIETSKFMAINPQLAFSGILENYFKNIKKVKQKTIELKEKFDTYNVEEDLEVVKILHSRASIEDTISKLEAQAEHEVLAFCKGPFIMNFNQLNEIVNSQKKRIISGIVHKAIYEVQNVDERLIKIMVKFSDIGEKIRVIENLPLKMLVYDASIAVFTFETRQVDTTFTSLADEDVAKTFQMIFKLFWKKARSLEEYLAEKL